MFSALLAEIRRRDVLRVVAVYAVGAWLILQIAEVTLQPLGFPPWVMRVLIVASLVGFPVVFFLAWIIRIDSRGLIFDLPLWRGDAEERIERKTDYVVVAALAALLLIGVHTIGTKLLQDVEPILPVVSEIPENSIAVLAFENFSDSSDSDYFSGGIAEEILNLLAGLQELSVASRSSSFQFRGTPYDPRDVAKTLAVKHILEGSVRSDLKRIRVAVQLVDGEKGYSRWVRTYDRELSDIFLIQEEIAASVVDELKIALSVDSQQRLSETPTDDLDAYIFYLQGIQRLRSPSDIAKLTAASEFFMRATSIDEGFSRAFAGLCETHLALYEMSRAIADFDAAEDACRRAAELDPELNTDIRVALGTLYRHRGWYEQALDQLHAAIALTPAAVDGYIELGEAYLADNRRSEAETAFSRATEMKPNYWRAHSALGSFFYETEQYSAAAKQFSQVVELAPQSAAAYGSLGAALWMLGRHDDARNAYDRSLQLKPTRQGYTNLGLRYYYAGDFAAAAEMQLKAIELAPDDHRLWGRLAESYRFVDGADEQADQAYRRAAELASANLLINDTDWRTAGLNALYLAHLDQPKRAIALAAEAVQASADSPEALYYQALVLLRQGQRDTALAVLEKAVSVDPQYRQFIAGDPDLRALDGDPRFQALLP